MKHLPGCPARPWLDDTVAKRGSRFGEESRDNRGRVRVSLGPHHRYANSGGWQWRYRLVVTYALGRKLRPDEHVDHIDGTVDHDRVENLRLLGACLHGRYHAWLFEVAGCRASDGRFVELEEGIEIKPANRIGPVVSCRALDPATWEPVSAMV